eukprot:scaffold3944_cov361-Prasinococcus_capsulatus_cf.AAC.6
MIKNADDPDRDPLGFITVLNWAQCKEVSALAPSESASAYSAMVPKESSLIDPIFPVAAPGLSKNRGCHSEGVRWARIDEQLGLLLSERLLNIPYELVPPLYDALFDEVAQAGREEMLVPDNKRSFSFKYYLVMSSIYHEKVRMPVSHGTNAVTRMEVSFS